MKIQLTLPTGNYNLTAQQARCYLRSFNLDVELKGTIKLTDSAFLIVSK